APGRPGREPGASVRRGDLRLGALRHAGPGRAHDAVAARGRSGIRAAQQRGPTPDAAAIRAGTDAGLRRSSGYRGRWLSRLVGADRLPLASSRSRRPSPTSHSVLLLWRRTTIGPVYSG